jgi:hypothetical protein
VQTDSVPKISLSSKFVDSSVQPEVVRPIKRTTTTCNLPSNEVSSTTLLRTNHCVQVDAFTNQNDISTFYQITSSLFINIFKILFLSFLLFFVDTYHISTSTTNSHRMPLTDITQLQLNQISTSAARALAPPLRKRGRPMIVQPFPQTSNSSSNHNIQILRSPHVPATHQQSIHYNSISDISICNVPYNSSHFNHYNNLNIITLYHAFYIYFIFTLLLNCISLL